mmetsp:Transcript_33442/g.36982  ORF Transcript_33442/g.36982 Transcript_33442/m.36982 type:complete len:86 (-) Transcript_33442:1495-1752(-)
MSFDDFTSYQFLSRKKFRIFSILGSQDAVDIDDIPSCPSIAPLFLRSYPYGKYFLIYSLATSPLVIYFTKKLTGIPHELFSEVTR